MLECDFLSIARRVIAKEADALQALVLALDEGFVQAITHLARVNGRVIVSGIGKSGYIARKIAASLASTGTPAYFLHPAEASHGDLGMICSGDSVIVLSNSGHTHELEALVAHTRQCNSCLIAITCGAASPLARKADVALILPQVEEACGNDTVPTTTTTMMLALGDALVIALMQQRGFTRDQFRILHPGGHLGMRLSKVSDIMHCGDELPLVTPEIPMCDALLTMTEKGFGIVGVVSQSGDLIGVITDGDLRRHMDNALLTKKAETVMTRSPRTIVADLRVEQALAIMSLDKPKITCLFVVKDENHQCPIGLVHIHDCLRIIGQGHAA